MIRQRSGQPPPVLEQPLKTSVLAPLNTYAPLNVDSLLHAIAAHGLPQAAPYPWPLAPISSDLWNLLIDDVRSQRLTAPLMAILEAGCLPALPAQLEAGRRAHVEARALVLLLEHELLRVSELLSSSGMSHLV